MVMKSYPVRYEGGVVVSGKAPEFINVNGDEKVAMFMMS